MLSAQASSRYDLQLSALTRDLFSCAEQAIRQQKLAVLDRAGVPAKYRTELAKKNFVALKLH